MLAILICAALLAGKFWLEDYLHSSNTLQQPRTLLIEPGTGGEKIATLLAQEGIIQHPQAFRLAAILHDKHHLFQAGEYAFAAGISPWQVMEQLRRGEVLKYKITIPEGKTSAEIVSLLHHETRLKDLIQRLPAEGRLLPETYHFTRGESRNTILQRMANAQDAVLQRLWPQRQPGLPVATPQEAITLASIVEKETGKPAERRRVAAVYINRLKRGMKLQADPTVSYGLHGGQSNAPSLTYDDLKRDNPYNTYVHHGLPPGPICHPGEASIAAVLNPLNTKELYFVATGDGGHYFANTYTEHLQNVKRYRAWQRQQGK